MDNPMGKGANQARARTPGALPGGTGRGATERPGGLFPLISIALAAEDEDGEDGEDDAAMQSDTWAARTPPS